METLAADAPTCNHSNCSDIYCNTKSCKA